MNQIGQPIEPNKLRGLTLNVDELVGYLTLNKNIFFSWGGYEFQSNDEDTYFTFKVNGMKFKGQIYIILNGLDLFEAYFVKENIIVEKYNDLYCDMVMERIDNYIEKIKDYKF